MIRILFNQFSSVSTLSIISFPLKIKHNYISHIKKNSFVNCCDIRLTKPKQAQFSNTVRGRKLYFINYVTKTILKNLLMKH